MEARAVAARAQGFTLIEVLVAFTILSLSLVALYQGFSVGLKTSQRAERVHMAVALAKSQLARVGTEVVLDGQGAQGTYDGGYRWRIEAEPFELPEENKYLVPYQVTVSVIDDRNGRELVVLKTLRMRTAR